MKVDVWSDVVCPWCYIGKRRLEGALARFAHAERVEIVWHSFELDTRAPRQVEGDSATRLAAKYGMTREQAIAAQARVTGVAAREGLPMRLERSKAGNTFDAHRLLHLAADRGLQDAVKERLCAAYLCHGEAIGVVETLIRLASEAGLDAAEARAVLEGDRYSDDVRDDESRAAALGITAVPFFVVDDRYPIAGAQSSDLLLEALQRAWSETHVTEPRGAETHVTEPRGADDVSCDGDACVI